MNSVTQAVAGLFSISSLISFVLGVGCTIAYYRIEDQLEKKHCNEGTTLKLHKFRSLWILWSLVFILTGYIGFQQYETARDVRQLAANTLECQRQFNAALKTRSAINEANDKLSREQRDALAAWFREILQPPDDILAIRENDPNFGNNPVYVKWAYDTTARYYNVIQRSQNSQTENDKMKPSYPEPSCGN